MILHLVDTAPDITVTDNSYRYQTIMGDHSLTLYFALAEPIDIPLGAWCEFQGQTYTLYSPATFVKQSSRNFEYTAIMESEQSKLKLYKFRNPLDKRLKFSLTAKPKDHLRMVVDNLKLRDKEWSVGECIDAAQKSIQYSAMGCDGALQQIAETLDTEWEVVGKTIHLRKVEYNKQNPLPLSYGRGNGFKPGVGRTNFDSSKPVEVLYVEGGDRNIDFSTYKSKTLLLPTGQSLVYEGRTYVSDAEGYSISRAEGEKHLHTGQEQSLDLTHIYPGWEHTVTDARDVSDDEKVVKWDIFACNTADYPNNSPESLDYTKCRIKGDTARVIFQSGILAGKEFDLVQTENELTGYVHAERRYMLVSQEIDGQTMPSATFAPKLGDKFKVFGISMPDTYLRDNTTQTGASWDMFREAAKWLYEHEEPRFTFTGELDGIWASGDWINIGGRIRLGGYVAFSDEQFQKEPVLIRISGVTDMINNPHSPIIELSNEVSGRSFMSEIGKIEQNEIVTEELHNEALQFTRRRWQDARQATQMLEKAMLDNFTGAVNPVAVHTMQLLVGDENLQFRFVNNKTNPQLDRTSGYVTLTGSPSQVNVTGGILQHMTLGIKKLATEHQAKDYRFWDMSPFTSAVFDDTKKSYYLFAKVSITGTTGEFCISTDYIFMDSDKDNYHLLYGLIGSDIDGERSFVALNGFAELTPGMLTIPMIKGQGADKDMSAYGILTIRPDSISWPAICPKNQ